MNSEVLDGVVGVALFGIFTYTLLLSLGLISYITYTPKKGSKRAGNFEVVIVSKANHKVRNSLSEVVKYHVRRYGQVTLVVDEGAPLIPQYRGMKGVKLVVVPSNYRRDLVGKGRALQYFVECCVEDNKWYVFIDDDNLILDDSFLYEIPVYEQLGYVAANGVLVPRPSRSTIAFVMDWIRYIDDLFIYRFFTGLLGRPFLGLHGDLLIVRGNVLREIGFKQRSLTEDFEFAVELIKRGYKTWQSSTRVSIKSPNSLRDLIMQRGRWFKGVVSGIKRAPVLMKLLLILRSFTFTIGVLLILLVAPLIYYVGLVWIILPGSIYYVTAYSYGVYKSKKPHLLLLLPFFGIIEAYSRVYGLIAIHDFVVIDKN